MRGKKGPLRLLSLDGGGIRGLSSIMILKDIMKGVNENREPTEQLQPWQIFDLIGGTSTGGLIGVMLGRLRMTIDECLTAYIELSESIFTPKRSSGSYFGRSKDFWNAGGRFDSQELEDAIKEIITGCKLPEESLFKDPDSDCKVFVCAILTSNSHPVVLRSYANPQKTELLYETCKIWEACRATSAATTFFDPITIGALGQTFADGAVRYNNPIQLVYREANNLWPEQMRNALLISIGTGSAPGPQFEGNIPSIISAMKKIITGTEHAAAEFMDDHESMVDQDLLFRFNVDQGLADVGLEEYKKKRRIADATQAYLDGGEMRYKWRKCKAKLQDGHSEVVKAGPLDAEEQACLQSLAFPEIEARQHDIDSALDKTCIWLFKHPNYRDWLNRKRLEEHNGLLWIKGKPGSGKSTLMKEAIKRDLKRRTRQHSAVLSFFFSARGSEMQKTPEGLFRSLLHQLFRHSRPMLSKFLPAFRKKRETQGTSWAWHLGELQDFFSSDVVPSAVCSIIIYIDALDECRESDARHVMGFLESWTSSALRAKSNLSICVSSRHYPNITVQKSLQIMVDDKNQDDISRYIRSKLPTETAEERKLEELILQKASGVFLWVKLVVESLVKAKDDGKTLGYMRNILESCPGKLDDLYKQMLEELDDLEKPLNLHIMQWVLFALRPLKVRELRYALAFDTSNPYASKSECQKSDEFVKDDIQMVRLLCSQSRGLVEVKWHDDYYFCANDSDCECDSNSDDDGDCDCASNNSSNSECAGDCRCDCDCDCDSQSSSDSDIHSHDHIPIRSNMHSHTVGFVQIIHESVRKFLLGRGLQILDTSASGPGTASWIGRSHDQMRRTCVSYMAIEELRKASNNRPSRVAYPFLLYATWSWLKHAQRAESEGLSQAPLLECFEGPKACIFERWYSLHGGWRTPSFVRFACEHGLLSCVKAFKEAGEDVDPVSESGNSPLSIASGLGHQAIAQFLLDEGADVNTLKGGRNALHSAIDNEHIAMVRLLLDSGADVNLKDYTGRVALHLAVENLDIAMVQLLLQKEASVDATNDEGETALHFAMKNQKHEIARLLLKKGANTRAQAKDGQTALHWTTSCEKTEGALLLLNNNANTEARDIKGQTALHMALRHGNTECALLLLSRGAKIGVKSKCGRTALHYATLSGKTKVVKLVLKTEVMIDAIDEMEKTALHYAAMRTDSTGVMKLLLDKGAALNEQDQKGQTALHYAVTQTDPIEPMKLLLDAGAALDKQDRRGQTALHYVAKGTKSIGVLKLLLDKGAALNEQDQDGLTALHYAATPPTSFTGVMKLLLENKAELETRDNEDQTALHKAVTSGDYRETVQLLLESGADINAQDEHGWTPLHLAALWRQHQTVQLLLEKGAKLGARDKMGRTVLHIVAEREYSGRRVVELLVHAGADVYARDYEGRTALDIADQRSNFRIQGELKSAIETKENN